MAYMNSSAFLSGCPQHDALLIGNNKTECSENITRTIGIFRLLGFLINLEKSCLHPTKVIQFLGFIFNTKT
nr:unnamed protein product [Callosobruchus chinensis]